MKTAILLGVVLCAAGVANDADPWKAGDLMPAAALAGQLKSGSKPKLYHVGFNVLYRSKHIPGSVYAGPGSKEEGIEALKRAVSRLPKDAEIVIYCGCCPFDHCPNVRPAYQALAQAGYHHVKVLDIPDNFTHDWIEKGYPVEAGSAATSSDSRPAMLKTGAATAARAN